MNEWPIIKLNALVDAVTVGHVGPMANEYVPAGIPFLRSQNVEPFRLNLEGVKYISPSFHARLGKSSISHGDVVIVRTGQPGTCAVVPQTLPVANCSDLIVVKPGKNVDARWLAYYINIAGHEFVASRLVGAVQQHFNIGSAREMKLQVPPLVEQRAIADLLGAIDDKIESNREKGKISARYVDAVFVRFARYPSREGSIGELLLNYREKVGQRNQQVIVMSATASGTLVPSDEFFKKQVYSKSIEKYLVVPQWSFAYNPSRINIGSIGLNEGPTSGAVSPVYVVAKAQAAPSARWIDQCLKTDAVKDQISSFATGSVRQVLRFDDFASIKIPMVDPAAMTDFYCEIDPLIRLRDQVRIETLSLIQFRDALLPDLLSGRIRVPNAPESVEATQ